MDELSLLHDSQENEKSDEPALSRKSLSQPILPQGSSQNVRSIPIIQTWHENEELKGKMYTLRCEVQMFQHRYEVAKETMHKSVQDVLDEYVTLKLNQDEADQKIQEFKEVNQQLIKIREELEDTKNKLSEKDSEIRNLQEEFNRKLAEFEKPSNTDISSLNLTAGSFKGTLDDILKKDDPDYTLVGPEEKRYLEIEDKYYTEMEKVYNLQKLVDELRDDLSEKSARLAEADMQRIQLLTAHGQGVIQQYSGNESKTFVIGNARESLTTEQTAYIDQLEKSLKENQKDLEKTTCALGDYMNRVSKLEKELHNWKKNKTLDTSSFLIEGKTADDLRAQISRVNTELNVLRSENRNLRIRCDQIAGGAGNVSDSFGQTRLLAGISAQATGRASTTSSMDVVGGQNENNRVFPQKMTEQKQNCDYSDSDSLMDLSSVRRINAEDDENLKSAVAEFEEYMANRNESLDYSLNASARQPPAAVVAATNLPRDSLNSRTSSALTTIPAHESSRRLEQNFDAPLLRDVQNILDSSAALIESNQTASIDVEKMQTKMLAVREALCRLFDRLKSSAALFEEILEKMGSSSPLADKIQQMKLAFETSMCDHEDVSQFLQAAEQDLNNLSLNYSMLEKSYLNQSALVDISRQFSIAPRSSEILSSSINMNQSLSSPVFKFGNEKIEKLEKQVIELREELARTRRSSSSTPEALQRQLSDTQVKASKNFEDLEVCQATLNRVEGEKAKLDRDMKELAAKYSNIEAKLGETEHELRESMKIIEEERKNRKDFEGVAKKSDDLLQVLESKIQEYEQHLAESGELCESYKKELREALDAEIELREKYEQLSNEASQLQVRASDAESKFTSALRDNQHLMESMNELEEEMNRLRQFENEQTNVSKKMETAENRKSAKFESYARSTQTTNEEEKEEMAELKLFESEAIDGLKKIQIELSGLVEKKLKIRFCPGNVSTIRMGCEEMCRRLAHEQVRRHEHAEVLRQVNDTLEKNAETMALATTASKIGQENIAPPTSSSSNLNSEEKKKYRDPTRQLLHDATQAIDAIVQKMKKTATIEGISAPLKATMASILTDSRQLRDFLHQKFMLFKSVDVSHVRSESCTYEQLLQKLEKSYQDFVIVDEECRKLRQEMKKMKSIIPTLGNDVESRIKKEIGGIARDMGSIRSLRK